MRLRALTIALLTLAACTAATPTSPITPPGAWRVSPEPEWREWHEELVACVGRDRPFVAIQWYLVPGESWVGPEAEDLIGQFWRLGTRIYLSEEMMARKDWTPKWLVKHEDLHYLLSPIRGHPSPPFQGCEFL